MDDGIFTGYSSPVSRKSPDTMHPPGAEPGDADPAGAPALVSRRRFLAGTGIGAAAGAVLEACKPAEGPGAAVGARPAAVVGPGRVPVTLVVNGQQRRVEIEPRVTLAEALRLELGLTGTKIVCDRGACSACTVWLDGVPVNSCMTFAIEAADRAITTVEGLARGGELHPVQRAFVEHDAAQCGFCTPGMVMSCAALLARTPSPTLDDVRAAVSGNLCRCGTYPKVFEATLAAARRGAGKG
jgi:aerobic-type carbon monoxide dehydrogenase small subunit (CoxS/CutS family)